MVSISKIHLKSLTLGVEGKRKKRKREGEGGDDRDLFVANQRAWLPTPSSYPLISPREILKYPYANNYNTHPRRGNTARLFVEAMDGHAVFTTSLLLDASFAMAPRALRSDLERAKSAPRFVAQTGQTCLPGFEAKPVKPSRMPPHEVTDSPVLGPNRSNHRC